MSELAALDAQLTDVGPQQAQPLQRNQHGLYVEFYTNPVQDKKESENQGRPIYRETPYIMIMVPGDKNSVVRRPVLTGQHPRHDNNRFHNEYIAFRNGLVAPIEGTMLSEWPQITRSQVLELQHLGIKTIEHLADLNDSNAGQFMGLSDLKRKAKTYLELTKDDQPLVKMQAELAERDNKIETIENVMSEMQAELAELKGAKGKKGK